MLAAIGSRVLTCATTSSPLAIISIISQCATYGIQPGNDIDIERRSLSWRRILIMSCLTYLYELYLVSLAGFDYSAHYSIIVGYWICAMWFQYNTARTYKIVLKQQRMLMHGETFNLPFIQKFIIIPLGLFAYSFSALIFSYEIYIDPGYVIMHTLAAVIKTMILLRHLYLPTILTRTPIFFERLLDMQFISSQFLVFVLYILITLIGGNIHAHEKMTLFMVMCGFNTYVRTIAWGAVVIGSKMCPITTRPVANWSDNVWYDQTECAICQDETPTKLVELSCKHIFHAACVQRWWQQRRSCPKCQTILQLQSLDDFNFSDCF